MLALGSLLKELDVGKKDLVSKLIKKAPRPPNLEKDYKN